MKSAGRHREHSPLDTVVSTIAHRRSHAEYHRHPRHARQSCARAGACLLPGPPTHERRAAKTSSDQCQWTSSARLLDLPGRAPAFKNRWGAAQTHRCTVFAALALWQFCFVLFCCVWAVPRSDMLATLLAPTAELLLFRQKAAGACSQ